MLREQSKMEKEESKSSRNGVALSNNDHQRVTQKPMHIDLVFVFGVASWIDEF